MVEYSHRGDRLFTPGIYIAYRQLREAARICTAIRRNLSDERCIAQLSSVQNFSRRVGISYEDLISILQTRFINPNAVLIPRLRHLGVPFKTLHDLKGGSLSEDAFKALLPADLDARKYGGKDVKDFQAVVNWVKNDANYNRIKRLIVIDVPVDATDPNSAASLELCFCDPDPSPPGNYIRSTLSV